MSYILKTRLSKSVAGSDSWLTIQKNTFTNPYLVSIVTYQNAHIKKNSLTMKLPKTQKTEATHTIRG